MSRVSQSALLLMLMASSTVALAKPPMTDQMPMPPPSFSFDGTPGGTGGATMFDYPDYLAGGRIVAADDGALVIDADSGNLILTNKAGAKVASLPIGADAGQLVYDPTAGRAFVADRRGDRIVVVTVQPAAKTAAGRLTLLTTITTPAEPFGLAMSPNRDHLLVTCIAAHTLVDFSLATITNVHEAWRHPLAPEPRGVAISHDGKYAMVTSLLSGELERVTLADRASLPIALATGAPVIERFDDERMVNAPSEPSVAQVQTQPTPTLFPSFARSDFAVRYIGNDLAVTAYQRETPVQAVRGRSSGGYGGGQEPPIDGHMTFIAEGKLGPSVAGAFLHLQQPQAMTWSHNDDLFVAGYGNDSIGWITKASQASAHFAEFINVSGPHEGQACGPQGLAMASDGSVLVWCAMSRIVVRFRATASTIVGHPNVIDPNKRGPELAASRMSPTQHRGMELFRRGDDAHIAGNGSMACASCHPEGRDDGLTWRISDHTLQTPLLAGRVDGTHPYKWDGTDETLDASIISTTARLGGLGLSATDRKAVAAYLISLPKPRTPPQDAASVARGAELFASADLGCASCHHGTRFTNNKKYEFGSADLPSVDTPSLVGLAASAPYYHDGSATSLGALVHGQGSVHGMAELSGLDEGKARDLVAYLETL